MNANAEVIDMDTGEVIQKQSLRARLSDPLLIARAAAGIFAIALIGAVAAALYFRQVAGSAVDDTLAQKTKLSQLEDKGRKQSADLAELREKNSQLSASYAAVNGQVAAFAKQAAACNELREQMHIAQ